MLARCTVAITLLGKLSSACLHEDVLVSLIKARCQQYIIVL
jgi:hypothetical protein